MSAETAIVNKEKTKTEESTDHDPKATVLEKTTPTEIVTLPLTEQETLERFNRTQHLKRSLLDPKTDMILIAGKPYIKKSGWRKLQFAFNLTDSLIQVEKEDEESNGKRKRIWRMWVQIRAPNGRQVIGVASASSDEKKFSHADHDPYALCHTRAKNRAIGSVKSSVDSQIFSCCKESVDGRNIGALAPQRHVENHSSSLQDRAG